MNKICIDARFWGIKHTGIGRYVENLIDNLPGDVILIVHPELKNEPKLAKFKKYYAKYHPYSYISQFEILWLLLKIKPDLLHVPHFTIPVLWPGKLVVTIHDLIKHQSRGQNTTTQHRLIYWFKYLGYLLIVWLAVHRASHIIVPANYWREILIKKYNLNPRKISVTYEGVFKRGSPFTLEGGPPSSSYLVYTGNLYPHKNIPILIKAAERLKINLKIICARSVFENRLPESKYVEYLGRLTDEEMIEVYKKSQVFVFPSLIEGFGLPGLEAMSVGLPVIAANASCLPEVYGDAALYFDPYSVDDLVSKIQLIINDQKLRQMLIAKGQLQVKKYSWAKMSKQTWEIYQEVMSNR